MPRSKRLVTCDLNKYQKGKDSVPDSLKDLFISPNLQKKPKLEENIEKSNAFTPKVPLPEPIPQDTVKEIYVPKKNG